MAVKEGVFYGVSVGPGDPELMTIKALRVIERCPVIAAPVTAKGRMLALEIARKAIDIEDSRVLPLPFSMSREKAQRLESRVEAANAIEACLAKGKDVAMLNLGDVSIYSTFGHIADLLKRRGYETAMIPGVPSFCAVAACLGESLSGADEPIHILPAVSDIGSDLSMPGTKIIMKSGSRLNDIANAVAEQDLEDRFALVGNCGLPDEFVCRSPSQLPKDTGYFCTIVIKE